MVVSRKKSLEYNENNNIALKSSIIAKEACANSGFEVAYHIVEVNEVISIKEQAKFQKK